MGAGSSVRWVCRMGATITARSRQTRRFWRRCMTCPPLTIGRRRGFFSAIPARQRGVRRHPRPWAVRIGRRPYADRGRCQGSGIRSPAHPDPTCRRPAAPAARRRRGSVSEQRLGGGAEVPLGELLAGVDDSAWGSDDGAHLAHQSAHEPCRLTERLDRIERRRSWGPGAERERRRDGEQRQQDSGAAGGHLAVVPRCWKKLTSPGAAPTTRADAPEITAAIRPRAANWWLWP